MTESDMTGSKLVFIDIDGTLADENHIVPESAKTACARAQANGQSSSSAPVDPCRKSNATFWILDSTV